MLIAGAESRVDDVNFSRFFVFGLGAAESGFLATPVRILHTRIRPTAACYPRGVARKTADRCSSLGSEAALIKVILRGIGCRNFFTPGASLVRMLLIPCEFFFGIEIASRAPVATHKAMGASSMKTISSFAAASIIMVATSAVAAPINEVSYGSIAVGQTIDFEGLAPGTNYDSVLNFGGVKIGERFAGQTLSSSGNSDVLGGTPSSPLNVIAGATGENVTIFDFFWNKRLSWTWPNRFPEL